MAVQRRVNWISQQRVDVPDMRAVESAASNDWDQSTQAFVTNVTQGYILRGFELSMTGAIGGAASNLQMIMDPGSNPSSVMHILASQSGTILMVPPGTPLQQLNSSVNTNVTGAFSPNALNYIGLDYTRFIDPTTDAQVYLWDPTTNSETTLTAPRAMILQYQINVSTTSWASNFLPIAIVQTDASNNVVSITDCRWLLFRLGTGGSAPDPFHVYPWNAQPEGRTENSATSSSDSVNPFEGGDKMLFSLKDWMDAIMTTLLEVKGGTFWYSGSGSGGLNPSPGSLTKLREDALNTITVGQGTVTHGILPNNDPVLTTTGTLSGAGGGAGGSLNLGTAGNFAIGAYSAITGSTGSGSIVNGDMFITPSTMSSVTNFPPSVDNGTIHAADSIAVQAQTDAQNAFNAGQAAGLAGTTILSELGGQILTPGAYKFASGSAGLSLTSGNSTLTFNGAGTYIIYTASTLLTGATGSTDVPTFAFTGGATPSNTFINWIVGSAATINQSVASAGATFYGNVIASAAITAVQAGTINGRLISLTASVTLTGTNTINSASGGAANTITGMASTVGLVIGQFIFGAGIPFGTTITAIGAGTVTMSHSAVISAVGETISFYNPAQVTAAGQVNWSDPIYLKVVGSALSYEIAANPTSADILLADDKVAYIILGRDLVVTPNLLYTYNSIPDTTTVVSVGAVAWTGSLLAGDFIRAAADPDSNYAIIQSVDSGTQVTLTGNYVPASENPAGVPSVYALGSYSAVASPSGPRDIYIASRADVPVGQNTFWLFAREDVGGPIPTVYVHFLGQELEYGSSLQIDGAIPKQLLQYIGSPSESDSTPDYTSALITGSLPQITSITAAAASALASNQYFLIYSSSASRFYYVWVNKDGTGVDPAPNASATGIQWVVSTGQTAAQTATSLASALNATLFNDFTASAAGAVVTVTNNSAGEVPAASNFNVGTPFAISTTQFGTGVGNAIIQNGDNLTLAIKLLDAEFALILANANNPNYDEPLDVIAGVPVNSNQITGPISPGTNITLPLNSREAETAQLYITGRSSLELFLNGQYLNLSTSSAPITAPMLSYHMSDGSYPLAITLTGARKGGLAIKYTPASNVNLTDIQFIMSRTSAGTATGTVTASVRSNSAGIPGGVLGTSTLNEAVSSLTFGTNSTVLFPFSSPIALTGGTTYWFSLETNGAYQTADGAGGASITVQETNISVPSGTTPVDFINHTAVTNASNITLGSNTSGIIEGPWFVAQQTAKITSAQVSVTFVSGTGNLVGDLYLLIPDNTGVPNVPTMTFIESSAAINITTLPVTLLNPALTTLTFSGLNTLTSGNQYAVVLRSTNPGGSDVRSNYRVSGTSPGNLTGQVSKNFGADNLYHQTDSSNNPLVYSGDKQVIASGLQTTFTGEYPIATYTGSVWSAQSDPTTAIELDIITTGSNGDWTEVGAPNIFSNQIRIDRSLVVGDILTFRIDSGGGSAAGAAGPEGPAGPAGPSGAGPGGPAPISTKISNYTVLTGDCILKADCSSGAIQFLLPSASSMAGRIFYFTKVDATSNAMTMQAAGIDTINGLSSQTTSIQYDSFMLVSDGTTWSML